jgi:hypothetical protein
MATNDDIYSEEQSALQQIEGPTGSVFLNNTSYSGADIKLVVHVYDAGASKKDRLKVLGLEAESLSTGLDALQSEYTRISTKLASAKPGTPEQRILNTQASALKSQILSGGNSLISTADEIDRLQKSDTSLNTKVLAEVQTISISTHRDKRAIRSLGKVYPVGFSRGQREIAGSMIFTVFNEHVLYQLLDAHPSDFDATAYTSSLLDQLPPMDITIAFANEYGQLSRMGIYGVEFVNEGQTMSIEDIMTENVCNYVARDFDPMRSVAQRNIDEGSRLMSEWVGTKASDLILEDEYQNVKSMLDPFERFKRRSNPFL